MNYDFKFSNQQAGQRRHKLVKQMKMLDLFHCEKMIITPGSELITFQDCTLEKCIGYPVTLDKGTYIESITMNLKNGIIKFYRSDVEYAEFAITTVLHLQEYT